MSGLCYSAPVHLGWNLAHICRLIPEAHVLFATPPGCSRIIRLSAVQKGISESFTTLDLSSDDIVNGSTEERILSGARDALAALKAQGRFPRAMLIFISCIDGFIGTDHEYYLGTLRDEFPSVKFLDCAMDPINREKQPPIVRMQSAIASLFEGGQKARAVNWLGRFLPVNENHELKAHLNAHGVKSMHAYNCRTMDEMNKMGKSALNIVTHPTALPAAKELEKRLGMPWFGLFSGDIFRDFPAVYDSICSELGIPPMDTAAAALNTHAALTRAAQSLKGISIAVSGDAAFTPYSLALILISHGFDVSYVFADEAGALERDAQAQLSANGNVRLIEEGAGLARAFSDGRYAQGKTVAIGADAAYFCKTPHFISRIAFGGETGFNSLADLGNELVSAAAVKKDMHELTLSGRGCSAL